MKNGKKNPGRPRSSAAPKDKAGDPFADFMEDFNTDPDQPLKFLRSFMAGEEAYNPAVDVVEERDKLTIIVDLPGVSEEELKVVFVEGGIVIRGRRTPVSEPPGSRLRRAERPAGDFSKSIPLPTGLEIRNVGHRMENGVLTLSIPRGAASRTASETKALKAGGA